MAEAGYPNGEGFPLLTCSYAQSPNYDLLFQYLEAVWSENLGITVKLESLESSAMGELRDNGKFLITPQGWGPDWLDASNMLSILTCCCRVILGTGMCFTISSFRFFIVVPVAFSSK